MASYLTSFVRSVVTGRSALADFPYQIGDVVHETSLWKIHTGTKKVKFTFFPFFSKIIRITIIMKLLF